MLVATHPVMYISVSITKPIRSDVKKKAYLKTIGPSHVQFGMPGKNHESNTKVPNKQRWT